ncbi:MAG: hypothetical protein JW776_02405 [Candidatus Lokiarchaeota archaeon]|nr:hypothetical protein [Candidatus Lokiarchaeota archaeon]
MDVSPGDIPSFRSFLFYQHKIYNVGILIAYLSVDFCATDPHHRIGDQQRSSRHRHGNMAVIPACQTLNHLKPVWSGMIVIIHPQEAPGNDHDSTGSGSAGMWY